MLEARIIKRLGTFTLDVQTSCHAGVTGIFGPSGSGKTTLLNCIAGVTNPDDGKIAWGDQPWFDPAGGAPIVPAARRRIGYIFQDSLLFPHMTVRENLIFGRPARAAPPGIDEIAGLLEIEALMDRRPDEISGGEARRAAVGRAILSNPRLMLFDEPLTGLDAALAARVLAGLKRVLDRCRIPAIYVSHTISDVLFLCDDVVILSAGAITARGSARATLLRSDVLSPMAMDEARNVFAAPVVDRRTEGAGQLLACRVGHAELIVFAPNAVLRAQPSEALTLSIRASDIVLARERPVGLSARNVFPGMVESVIGMAEKRLVLIDAGAPWMVEISATAERELRLKCGADVFLVLKTSAISVC